MAGDRARALRTRKSARAVRKCGAGGGVLTHARTVPGGQAAARTEHTGGGGARAQLKLPGLAAGAGADS